MSRSGAWVLRGVVAVLLALLCALPGSARAGDIPAFRAMVTDQAGVLSPELRSRLEAQLLAYQRQTGHQLALLIVPSLEGDAIEEFSIRVVEQWKLGDEVRDDGVLLLVAMADRKIRIETGHGLEGDLTDAASSRIIRDIISPEFKRGDPEAGIVAGVSAIMAATGSEAIPLPERPAPARRSQRRSVGFPPFLLLALFVLPFLFGGRGGPGGRRRSAWGAAPLFFGGGGFGGGRSGFGGGGGFGGGSSGGGGFSGGGGGSFGGGGASGSW